MKAIGGYFGLECGHTPLYYEEGVYLNSCRNALRYLIRSLDIKKIHLPVYTCQALEEAVRKEHCEILRYNIDEEFYPVQNIPVNDFIVYNNYFGLTLDKVKRMASVYPNLITDNAQAFYSEPLSRFSIYSLRKFFGVPDGGILMGKEIPSLTFKRGLSYEVMSHLLVRTDINAREGYPFFQENERVIGEYPLQQISKLTYSLLGNIDYEEASKKRLNNFRHLSDYLEPFVSFSFPSEESIPLVFPFYHPDGENIRSKLISHDIFCALYWPNVLNDRNANKLEKEMAKNIVALPIDQRYGVKEMDRIIKTIQNICR